MYSGYARALPRKWQGLAQVFSALGDEQRQRMLLMFGRNNRELTIKAIYEACPLSRTAVSHHLRVLRDAGVLKAEKRGKEVFLSPQPQRVLDALDSLRHYIEEELQ